MPAVLNKSSNFCSGFGPKESRPKREGEQCVEKPDNNKWLEGFEFRWKFTEPQGSLQDRNSGQTFNRNQMERIFQTVFSKWARVSGFKFTRVEESPNFNIKVLKVNSSKPFKSSAYAQGGADFENLDDGAFGFVEFNNFNFTGTWSPTIIHNVFLHEVGHAIGLNHTCDIGAVMYPALQDTKNIQELSDSDILHFKRLMASEGRPWYVPPQFRPSAQQPKSGSPAAGTPTSQGDVFTVTRVGSHFKVNDGPVMYIDDVIKTYRDKKVRWPGSNEPFILCGPNKPLEHNERVFLEAMCKEFKKSK
ncbi:hypothetical protein TWF694_008108 [Orbilia ellipsospora]|uniref:Peptidase metallopeptidase domain-containing protein n=1 Tax=Orbilia ellipsospora TaxID=2528407 RepID=A0AAV9XGI2_9PEZI